jgi:uncharacterized protein YqgC (DUF456 family)
MKCPACKADIDNSATRCPFCTSEIETVYSGGGSVWSGIVGAIMGILIGAFFGIFFGSSLIGAIIFGPLCGWLTYKFGFASKRAK